ncbi:early nodulin-like protein 5 [Actinidia rufa]|uniref:Early nodulin-like protein 5 n=1 Tax=Actinidia rufa TaxID=165716 RepID=A0A7J0FGP3_9ERIC|nr:early nodulin-like protein 5 [Actinidia rufa]
MPETAETTAMGWGTCGWRSSRPRRRQGASGPSRTGPVAADEVEWTGPVEFEDRVAAV